MPPQSTVPGGGKNARLRGVVKRLAAEGLLKGIAKVIQVSAREDPEPIKHSQGEARQDLCQGQGVLRT